MSDRLEEIFMSIIVKRMCVAFLAESLSQKMLRAKEIEEESKKKLQDCLASYSCMFIYDIFPLLINNDIVDFLYIYGNSVVNFVKIYSGDYPVVYLVHFVYIFAK